MVLTICFWEPPNTGFHSFITLYRPLEFWQMWWDFAEKHVSPSFFFANLFWLKIFWLELGINVQATAANQIVLSRLLGQLVWCKWQGHGLCLALRLLVLCQPLRVTSTCPKLVYSSAETLPTINKPKHPKKTRSTRTKMEGPTSKKTKEQEGKHQVPETPPVARSILNK
jgi:hypothetical protein